MPPRPMPVSTWTWKGFSPASERHPRTCVTPSSAGVRSCLATSASASVTGEKTTMRRVIPAARSSAPSSGVATP